MTFIVHYYKQRIVLILYYVGDVEIWGEKCVIKRILYNCRCRDFCCGWCTTVTTSNFLRCAPL